MLRSGFANYYKEMPCVGGYIDGALSNHGSGNEAIVNGRNREYGFKAIGIFQTSDNRKRDHADLGTHTTWVKWSEPTAEALRQACLAKESRLSQAEPELPSLWIKSMSVSNSTFLARVEIDLNQQYNALIGGRGTGKSTILEYLRWGVCDQPADDVDADLAPVQTRRKKLIADTLQKVEGDVIITFVLNGVQHIVKRQSSKQELVLKIGEQDFASVTEDEVRNLFPVQAYSQKQLSSIGVRLDELKRFVELPLKQTLDQIRAEIKTAEAKTRAAYSSLSRRRAIEQEIAKYDLELASLSQQLAAMRSDLKGLTVDDQAIINKKIQYDAEQGSIDALKNDLERAKVFVDDFGARFGTLASSGPRALADDSPNAVLVEEIRRKVAAKVSQIEKQAQVLADLFADSTFDDIELEIQSWNSRKIFFDQQYEATKAKSQINQEQLSQIQAVEKRFVELGKLQQAKRNALSETGNPESDYSNARSSWNQLHNQKIQALDGQCATFSALSNGLIKADVSGSLNTDDLKTKLKIAFASLNIREQKIDDICQRIAKSPDPMIAWNEVLSELEQLFRLKAGGLSAPATPALASCAFTHGDLGRLAAGLDSQKWLTLSLAELEFNPIFQYCANKATSEYIDFADASAGQQATALLMVLLNQSGGPLIIDQPEDDVDSKMSTELVQQIWKAKSKRQLIFASHNANFVVNGDAELVVCCDYVKAGDQTGGQIKMSGAIDSPPIKDEITLVTEGGKDAFKLRMEKYGF